MPFNATKFYSGDLSEKTKKIAESLGDSFETIFLVEEYDSLDKLIENLNKSDVIGKLVDLISDTSKDVLIDEWTPKKLEGLHACIVEKGLRVRYQAPSMKDLYAAASEEIGSTATYMKGFKDGVKFG